LILDEIVAYKRVETARLKESESESAVAARARAVPAARDFAGALVQGEPPAVIAEIKRASPSRGVMVGPDFDPAAVAREYERGGAAAVSVLTDQRYFHGDEATLEAVRAAVGLPVLRKDFILDAWQVYESRAMCADALLLIVRALEQETLRDLLALTAELGMAALVEVHDERELDRSLDAGATVVGINNRNLDTFTVDLATTERLAPMVPEGHIVVSESGISSRAHVERVCDAGARAILVGESLVTSGDIAGKLRELRGDSS